MKYQLAPLDLLILSLATWLIAYIVVKLNSPGDFIRRFREWATQRATLPDGTMKPGGLGEWVSCIYCVAVAVGIINYLLWLTPLQPILYPFAISGLALMFHRHTGGFHT